MKPTIRTTIVDAIKSVFAEEDRTTPDYLLAEYLNDCLICFDAAANAWRGLFSRKAIRDHQSIDEKKPEQRDL